MNKYFVVLRKVGSNTPMTVTLNAKTTSDAIIEMCGAAGVQNTGGLLEFEVLRVLENDKYERVALKTERKPESTAKRIEQERAPIVIPEQKPAEVRSEQQYQPYNIKAA